MIFLLGLSLSANIKAEEINVAVASNFQPSLELLKQNFESITPHKINIISSSTGKLYAQIKNGAPYDIFMAADKERPSLLEKDQIAINDSRSTYAIGRLVLWSSVITDVNTISDPKSAAKLLLGKPVNHIAIASSKLAPYGLAAEQFINTLALEGLRQKLVFGENISQVFHLVASGSAEVGFIALSQLKNSHLKSSNNYWLVPEYLHQPIEQQLVLLNKKQAAYQFVQFLKTPKAIEIIKNLGYQVEMPTPVNREK